jgi:2-polyprenyl-3-methyl-5-hydroxy-6-metoxy-1,4-benzoquinol methylase
MDVHERLSLEMVSDHTLIATEHVHRYEFAARLCDGARVVDLACGTGYGSAVLARGARSVRGIDIDVATIESAMRSAPPDLPVSFIAADALAWLRHCDPVDVDVIVCFEGLEHMEQLDDVITELARLADGGVKLIVSVPNSETWGEDNPFHLTSFSLDAARQLFERLGDSVLLTQNLAEGSLIIDPDEPGDREPSTALRWAERVELEYANHFLAVVGYEPDVVRAASSAIVQLSYAPTYNRHIRNIELTNRELWRTNARLGWSAFSHSGSAAAARVRRDRSEQEAEADAARIEELSDRVDELTTSLRVTEEVLERYIREAQQRANRPARRVARFAVKGATRARNLGRKP